MKTADLDFNQIFKRFVEHTKDLKTLSVATCDAGKVPNSASKMLVDIAQPNHVYFLDYRITQTYRNLTENPKVSVSFMDDAHFIGYRLTGGCDILEKGEEFDAVRQKWERRLISYEADRILKRVMGEYSARDAENVMPKDFVIMKITATEAAIIRPDRVLRGS
ncbi:MAG TPA: pyridoxamine 5'-phosphate oxidase family protein [Verrucomicrobiae bacterium]|nr:pyridoxamine 5'-phosphate oxidase family protein [Verrucomicrobiae bacterium]